MIILNLFEFEPSPPWSEDPIFFLGDVASEPSLSCSLSSRGVTWSYKFNINKETLLDRQDKARFILNIYSRRTVKLLPLSQWKLEEEGDLGSTKMEEGVYMRIGNPAFCFFLYLTGVHFRTNYSTVVTSVSKKSKCRPIRTREMGVVSLSDLLYGNLGLKIAVLDRTAILWNKIMHAALQEFNVT